MCSADANSMYWYASEAGLFSDDDNVDERVTYYGAEFLQLADALEVRQDNVGSEASIRGIDSRGCSSAPDRKPSPRMVLGCEQ